MDHGGILGVLHRKEVADYQMMADRTKEDRQNSQSRFGVGGCMSLQAVVMGIGGEGWGEDCGTRTFLKFIESGSPERTSLENFVEVLLINKNRIFKVSSMPPYCPLYYSLMPNVVASLAQPYD